MKHIIITIIVFFHFAAFAQQKESTLSISCYVNPELYLKAGVITFISDKGGNPSCKGTYITIYNGNNHPFYYRLSTATRQWKGVKPKQQVIIQVSPKSGGGSLSTVRLIAKYQRDTNSDMTLKMKTIAKMNAQSDKAKARALGLPQAKKSGSASPPKKAVAKSSPRITKPRTIQQSEATARTVKKETAKASSIESVGKKIAEKPSEPSDTTPVCFYTADTAYYTFYYMNIRDTVLYSDPFPVEHYEDEYSGQKLLSEAWGCFSQKIIAKFGVNRYNAFLNDVNNDLIMGFQHLRNPQIPSLSIVKEYPYTVSLASAQAELKKWIAFDKEKNKYLQLVKIDFP